MSRKIRTAVAALVLANLLAAAAYALPPAGRRVAPRSESFVTALKDWFASLLAPAGQPDVRGIEEKAGSSMDPDGINVGVSGDRSEEGSSMDPNG
jgi:hypothetical protein